MNETLVEHRTGGGTTTDTDPTPDLSSLQIWGYGFLFVTIINFSSVMGIIFFPLMKKSFYTIVMRCMIGLAIGSLSGSAIFHLIPQAFGLTHSNGKDYIFIASFIWLSIWLVMILECTIKIGVKGRAMTRQKKRLAEKLVNGSNNLSNIKQNGTPINADHIVHDSCGVDAGETIMLRSNPDLLKPEGHAEYRRTSHSNGQNLTYRDMEVYHSTMSLNKVVEENKIEVDDGDKCIKTVAWIVIIGDSLHNFIDGVSIGAGFTQSFSTGIILSLTVICEEFPHELGDFAILINSGLSVKKAILFNFLSAITCYLGLALGIVLGKIEFEHLIFAFAAGIFLYVSLVDMMPEVMEAIDKASDTSAQQAWLVLLNHHIGIIVGILILYILAANAPS